jgi:hypothetical protein
MRKLKDFPTTFHHLKVNKILTGEHMKRVEMGKIPIDMDDRWYIYYNNFWIYFHRSWTGNCIYKIKVNKTNDLYEISEVLVNGDIKEYKFIDENSEIKLFNELFDLYLESKF